MGSALRRKDDLMSTISSAYDTGEYSDLTLKCGTKTYPVHRLVVCQRSEFFRRAMRGSFREAHTGVVPIPEEEGDELEHMVYYFYHDDYMCKPIQRPARRTESTLAPDPLVALALAASGSPTAHAQQPNLQGGREKYSTFPVAGQVNVDPLVTVQTDPNRVGSSRLITHARVYAIAEKYIVEGLKSLAVQKFTTQLEYELRTNNCPDFAEACEEVYSTTIGHDRGLRDIIIKAFRDHPSLVLRPDVEEALRESDCLRPLRSELSKIGIEQPVFPLTSASCL